MAEEHVEEPSGVGSSRRRWWIIVAVAAVMGVAVTLFLLLSGGRLEVTYGQMNQVQPGMSEAQVGDILGETGDTGSFEDTAGTEWEDCWFYTVGPGPGQSGEEGEGVVCFQTGSVAFVSTPVFL